MFFHTEGAGIGRSVITALFQQMLRVLNLKRGENANDIMQSWYAYTGKAVFNLCGSSITASN